jgi:imidazolonepropionase-like amidohydrolase
MNKPIAIRAGTLIDGENDAPQSDIAILVENGRITGLESGSVLDGRDDIQIIDARDRVVMPGMMDIHLHLASPNVATSNNTDIAHFSRSNSTILLEAARHAQLMLEAGFTCVRDFDLPTPNGPIHEFIASLRDAIARGLLPGPRIVVAGMAHITASHFDLALPRSIARNANDTANGPWEIRRQVRENIRNGVDVLKTCVSGGLGTFTHEEIWSRNITFEELAAMADEAHAFGKRTAAHCHTPDSVRMALEAGIDTIEHCVFIDDDAVARLVEAGKPVIPTLAFRQEKIIERRRAAGASPAIIAQMETLRDAAGDTFRRYMKAGAKIAMGTDTNVEPGFGENAFELEVYVGLGMPPMDAIRTATRNAAEAIGREKELGTIAIGKLADLLVVNGNPLENIGVLTDRERIEIVMKDGNIMIDRRGKQANATQ